MTGVQAMDEAGSERNRSGPEWPNRFCMDGFEGNGMESAKKSGLGDMTSRDFFGLEVTRNFVSPYMEPFGMFAFNQIIDGAVPSERCVRIVIVRSP